MAADLYIHVFEGISEEDLKVFFSNALGSKWFAGFYAVDDHGKEEESYANISETPRVWVGEVSWLKAALYRELVAYRGKSVVISA